MRQTKLGRPCFDIPTLIWAFVCVFPVVALHWSDVALFTYDFKRFLQVGVFGVALVVILSKDRLVRVPAAFGVCLMVCGLFVIGFISASLSEAGITGRVEFGHLLVMCIFLVLLSAMLGDWKNALIVFCICNAVASGIYAFKFFVGYFAALVNQVPLDAKTLYFNVSHVRFYNQYQVWIMPILYWYGVYLWGLGSKAVSILVFTTLIANWIILFMGSARGGVLVLVLSSLLLAILLWKTYKRYFLWYFLVLFVSVFGFLLLQYYLPGLFGIESITEIVRTSDSGRRALWGYGLGLWVKYPILGVGNGGYAMLENPYLISHPHNVFFQYLAEWGGGAFLLVCGLYAKFGSWFVCSFRVGIKQAENPLPQVAVVSSLMGGMMYAFFSGVFIMPLSQAVAVLVIVLFASMPAFANARRPQFKFGAVYRVLVVMLVLFWCAGIIYSYMLLPEQSMPGYGFAPRLWHIGFAG